MSTFSQSCIGYDNFNDSIVANMAAKDNLPLSFCIFPYAFFVLTYILPDFVDFDAFWPRV